MEKKEELKLIYVNPIGKNTNGYYEYDFFFTDRLEIAYGENWDEPYALYGGDMTPNDGCYTKVRRIETDIHRNIFKQNR